MVVDINQVYISGVGSHRGVVFPLADSREVHFSDNAGLDVQGDADLDYLEVGVEVEAEVVDVVDSLQDFLKGVRCVRSP